VTTETERSGAAKEGGQIERGEADDVERLLVLMSRDCTLALEQVIWLDDINGVNEGGGIFS
jgi:hypothetical protein